MSKKKYIVLLLITITYSIIWSLSLDLNDIIPFTEWVTTPNEIKDKKIIIAFRNDDLSKYNDVYHESKVLEIFNKYKIKQTFAFIPAAIEKHIESNAKKDKKISKLFNKWESENRIEFALHGYNHKMNKYSKGEFKDLPYEVQYEKIKNGKLIADRYLKSNIKIFVPPWNQADENTTRACIDSGIDIISGYLGQKEAEKITFVNSNTALFKSRKENYSNENDIPTFEDALDLALNGEGIVFLIVIYHSRTDFRNASDFKYLDNLLKRLRGNPNIEIATIGEIATKYKKSLKRQNQAGINLKENSYAIHVAKPYLMIVRNVLGLFGKRTSIDRHYRNASIQYFQGRYSAVGNLSRLIVAKCKFLIIASRTIISLLYTTGFLIILFLFGSGTVLFSKRYFTILGLYVLVPIALPFVFLNILQPISSVRIIEINMTFLLCISSLTALTMILYCFSIRHQK